MNNLLTPIVLFVYNRPKHTEQTLEALFKNDLANESILYIYVDGPKEISTEEDLRYITETRQILRKRQWCREVHIIESEKNKGLANSIIFGVTEIVNKHGSVIVLEDDIVTSKGFLTYMNSALNTYRNDSKVMQVTGFIYPIDKTNLPETFFYNANSCWGWGTWKRAWDYYIDDINIIYKRLIEKPVNWKKFNAFQGRAFQDQLMDNLNGRIKTWAVKWHACVYLNDGMILHPRSSLTKNIGFDGSGVHCGYDNKMLSMDIIENIQVVKHKELHSRIAMKSLKKYFAISNQSTINKIIRKLYSLKNLLRV
ncbi:glycosyltransferase [Adhaeribacter radiodurans]|uniref:Glycosyltransferase family 2 protein n=1 Tax=Adhaeribacter radiodurans TaxID=2745197 RepID=A0A7L7L418_9BACT|nr:glycosyltransferase family A protein [Adhaeribacter radiodurans]QMU27561.1 glycosyltransferase family 2 protein [Adhaeribacter radiodurans]